jgi:uncharacterized SAM-binding protein YcdF (DUF218 family)
MSYVKEFTFDAGLPSILLILSCILLWFCVFRKIVKLLFTFASIFIIFICYKGTPTALSKPLLSEEGKQLQSKQNMDLNGTLIPNPLPSCIQNAKGIVVLGAGIYQKDVPSIVTQVRLLGLVSLFRNSKKDEEWIEEKIPIIFTGGITNVSLSQSEAQAMKEFMRYIYGNKTSNFTIITENKSKNTYQNSAYSKDIFDKSHYEKKIILITSTFHMFRAKRTFEKQGFQVCPIPVTSFESEGSGLFNFGNATKSVGLINEYLGIVGYTIKGWLKV